MTNMSLQTAENGLIAEMWQEALAEFQKMVPDKSFKDLAQKTTPEELRRKIEAMNSEADAKKNPKTSRAKDIGLKVIDVVKTFGGVAAEAAGMVFGPAQICFGALSIFLSIPRKVRDFHEFIEQVFIELEPVLSQFDIYIKMEKEHHVHDNLQTAIHKVMSSFVHLCGTVINIQQGSKWERFKRHTIQALTEDKDLQEELDKFRRIVNGLQSIQVTATYEVVVDTRAGVLDVQRSVDGVGTNVKKLVDEQNKRSKDEKKKAWLADIKTFLGLKEDDNSNPKARQETISSNRLKDTGKWLIDDVRFKKWADRHHSEADSTLYLTGPTGFGKSSLVSIVIDHLREQAAIPGLDHRSLVSFYYVPAQKDKGAEQTSVAETALKWIAAQLAEQDDTLCKSLAALAATPDKAAEVKRAGVLGLWDMLKIGSPSARTTNYLIFDDVDKFSEPARQQLAKILSALSDREVEQCPLKVLVCGDLEPEDFSPGKVNPDTVIKLDVDMMSEDFRVYIRRKLNAPNMLPGPACADRRARLEEKLLSTSGCSFRTIDIAMKGIERVIATSGDEGDMFRVVERSTQNEDDVVKELLAQLQAELGPLQINQINEVLMWVLFGNEGDEADEFEVSALEAAFRLRKMKLPIEGLPNFITRCARGLMHMADDSEGTIVLDEGVRKAIFKPRAMARRAEPPRINLEIKIVNADLPTARRFFWDLAKYATLDQFDFSADSPNIQSNNSKGIISVNAVDAHLAIVLATLDFLNSPPTPDTEDVGPCLVYNLARNLKVLYEATGLDAIDDELKSKIGKFVYKLFADPRVIETHWTKTFMGYRGRRLLSHESMTEFWRWLEDNTATRDLGTKDEEWLRKHAASDDKTTALVKDLGVMIARLWLEDKEYHDQAVLWINQFVENFWKKPEAEDEDLPDQRQIAEAESWCRQKLGKSEDALPALWYENLARTYFNYSFFEESITNFQKSTELSAPDPASWETMTGLSDALLHKASKKEEHKEAIAIKEKALEIYLGPKGSEIAKEDKLLHLENVALWCEFVLEQPDTALKHRKLALDLAPDDSGAQNNLFSYLSKTERTAEAQALLQSIAAGNTEGDSERKPYPFVGLIEAVAQEQMWEVFYKRFWIFISIAKDAGLLDNVLTDFGEAILRAKNSTDNATTYPNLVFHKGLVHFFNDGPEEIKLALQFWRESLDIAHEHHESGKTASDAFYDKVTAYFGRYYFDEATKAWRIVQTSPELGPEELTNLRSSVLEYMQKMEQTAAEYEAAIPNGELNNARCYRAAFLALRGNGGGARGVFKPDMVQVINSLSDDEQSNDSFALSKLRTILLFSGNFENAIAATFLTSPPYVGDKVPDRLRSVFASLLDPSGSLSEIPDDTPAGKLLQLLDAEKTAGQEADSILDKLIAEASKNLPSARETGGVSPPAQDGTEANENSLSDGAKVPEGVLEDSHDAGTGEAWTEIHKTLLLLKSKDMLGDDRGSRHCNSCVGTRKSWDFDTNFYGCKYCYDVDLCETCYEELKASDPEIQHPVCSPIHDWIFMPKWTPERWAESIRMVVRPPKKNEEGVLVPGVKTVELVDWLTEVTKPWGGLEAGKTWDHVKTPPPVEKTADEIGLGSGDGEAADGEEGKKDGDQDSKDKDGEDDATKADGEKDANEEHNANGEKNLDEAVEGTNGAGTGAETENGDGDGQTASEG
ncbi:hypothetical protein V8F33_011672 [Rhypophila sp. PSN 637]